MARFLDIHRRTFWLFGRRWGCYASRKDGVGWQFHCLNEARDYVDIGAGRRW